MCYYYEHIYTCTHKTYALGKYCSTGNLIQTPCKKRGIWQSVNMGEECDACFVPVSRAVGGSQARKGGVKKGTVRR